MSASPATPDQAWMDQDRGPTTIAVSVVLLILTTAAVSLRFCLRKTTQAACKIDDYLMIPALIFTVGLFIEVIVAVHFGAGKHMVRVSEANVIKVLQVHYSVAVVYPFVHLFIKASILALYRRTFTTLNRRFTIAIYVVAAYIFIWFVVTFFINVLFCHPVSLFWDRVIPASKGKCLSIQSAAVSTAILSIISDVALLILPAPIIWKMHLPWVKKLAISGIFALGILACAASIVRTYYMWSDTSGPDLTWGLPDTFIWTAIEPAVGILCACFPVMAPLFRFRQIVQRLSKKSSHGSSDASIPPAWPGHREKDDRGFTELRNLGVEDSMTELTDTKAGTEHERLPDPMEHVLKIRSDLESAHGTHERDGIRGDSSPAIGLHL